MQNLDGLPEDSVHCAFLAFQYVKEGIEGLFSFQAGGLEEVLSHTILT